MPSRVIIRALFSELPDAACKALREVNHRLGFTVDGERARGHENIRVELDAAACGARLLALSEHPDIVVRELAADALGAWGGEAARARLVALTSDPVVAVRASAVGALEYWPDDPEVFEVLQIAIDDSKWSVRLRAARAMAHVPGPAIERALLAALLDPDPYVRSSVADALAQRPPHDVLPHLRALFDHPAPHTFDAALDVFGAIGTADDAAFLSRVGRFTNWSQPTQVKRWARAAAKQIRVRLESATGA